MLRLNITLCFNARCLGRSARAALLACVSVALLSAQTMPWMHGINSGRMADDVCRSASDVGVISLQTQPAPSEADLNQADLNDPHTHCSVCVASMSHTQLPNFAPLTSWGLLYTITQKVSAWVSVPPYLRPYSHAPPHLI